MDIQITVVGKGVQSGAWRATVGWDATPLVAVTYDGASLPLVLVGRWMRGRKRHACLHFINKDKTPATFIPRRNEDLGTGKRRRCSSEIGHLCLSDQVPRFSRKRKFISNKESDHVTHRFGG